MLVQMQMLPPCQVRVLLPTTLKASERLKLLLHLRLRRHLRLHCSQR